MVWKNEIGKKGIKSLFMSQKQKDAVIRYIQEVGQLVKREK